MELVANRLIKRDDINDSKAMASILPIVGLCISKSAVFKQLRIQLAEKSLLKLCIASL
jgi:hypothetical protein